MSTNLEYLLTETNIMDTFWKDVAGRERVKTGNLTYIRPLNYETDEQRVIVDSELPILNLKGNNLKEFEKLLVEYIRTFFNSEKNWANPICSCNSEEDKLVHALSTLWLNATSYDFENPNQFIKRYIDFIKDQTFKEFDEPQLINKIQTLQNCNIEISRTEQTEFQETPNSIKIVAQKARTEKVLPQIVYGISENVAYIYGIQNYNDINAEERIFNKTVKKINRSRFAVNKNIDKVPEDYRNLFLKLEPYSYISLFAFLSMLKSKNINKIIMEAYLPERDRSREKFRMQRIQKDYERKESLTGKSQKELNIEIEKEKNENQRIQYNTINKFLYYMARMECEVPGLEIIATPDQTEGSMIIDISNMKPDKETNIIFYELYMKIQEFMNQKQKRHEGR